jgi:hypothetical protein
MTSTERQGSTRVEPCGAETEDSMTTITVWDQETDTTSDIKARENADDLRAQAGRQTCIEVTTDQGTQTIQCDDIIEITSGGWDGQEPWRGDDSR